MSYDLTEFDRKLIERNIIDLAGDIDRDLAIYLRKCLARAVANGAPPLTVLFTSSGGDVGMGLDMYDMLSLYPATKTGVVIGRAASMAAVILQGCTERLCARHANVMIHHISRQNVTLDLMRSHRRIEKTRLEMEERQMRIYKIFGARSGKAVPTIRAACRKESDMSAEEALEFGLIDRIVDDHQDITRRNKTTPA